MKLYLKPSKPSNTTGKDNRVTALKLLDIEEHTQRQFFEKLGQVTVANTDNRTFRNSYFTRERTITPMTEIYPCQRYILEDELYKVRNLNYMLKEKDFNMFKLEGYLTLTLEDAQGGFVVDLLPPIVEETSLPNGKVVNILNDGMHRVFLSILEHQQLYYTQVSGNNGLFHVPYYAFPIPDFSGENKPQWDQVIIYPGNKVPDGVIKRWPRIQDHKSLYRNFNSVFKGVSGRHTNPANR